MKKNNNNFYHCTFANINLNKRPRSHHPTPTHLLTADSAFRLRSFSVYSKIMGPLLLLLSLVSLQNGLSLSVPYSSDWESFHKYAMDYNKPYINDSVLMTTRFKIFQVSSLNHALSHVIDLSPIIGESYPTSKTKQVRISKWRTRNIRG